MRSRNTRVMARMAPAWMTMLKKSERAPSQYWAISRWPVLEIGRNSVRPSRMPSRRAASGSVIGGNPAGRWKVVAPRAGRAIGKRRSIADRALHHNGAFLRSDAPLQGFPPGFLAPSSAASMTCMLARRLRYPDRRPDRPGLTATGAIMSIENVEKLISDHRVEFVDL